MAAPPPRPPPPQAHLLALQALPFLGKRPPPCQPAPPPPQCSLLEPVQQGDSLLLLLHLLLRLLLRVVLLLLPLQALLGVAPQRMQQQPCCGKIAQACALVLMSCGEQQQQTWKQQGW